jgi:hypothetical protein
MQLYKGYKYSCTLRLNSFQSLGSNEAVKEYLEKMLPDFKEIDVTGSGKFRRVEARYFGETENVELDNRITNIQLIEIKK